MPVSTKHNQVTLAAAAEIIRMRAAKAAQDSPGDTVCCWGADRRGHQDRITETRISRDGYDDTSIVALPVRGGLAEHIGTWGPNTARAVADLLEHSSPDDQRAVALAHLVLGEKHLGEGPGAHV